MARPKLWKNIYYIDAYEHAAAGNSDTKIAELLGVSETTFDRWKASKPELKEALNRARKKNSGSVQSSIYADHVYNQLPAHLRQLWDRLIMLDNVDNGFELAEQILNKAGKEARQRLFLYAVVQTNFNQSEACRRVGISYSTLQKWKTDTDFAQLLEEIPWHLGNLFQGALIERVLEGSEVCAIFANKTFNASRGFAEKMAITSETEITHKHTFVAKMEDLADFLTPEIMRAILEAMRKKKERDAQLALPPPQQALTQQPNFTLPSTVTDAEVEAISPPPNPPPEAKSDVP